MCDLSMNPTSPLRSHILHTTLTRVTNHQTIPRPNSVWYKARGPLHWVGGERIWSPCRFDGERPWFVCSVRSNGVFCGRKVTTLYAGGRLFACRHCYDLAYMPVRR